MALVRTQGTLLKVGDGASPEAFTAVGRITGMTNVDAGESTEINVSDLDSTDAEFELGLRDNGRVEISFNYDDVDAQQASIRADMIAKTLRNFQIVTPSATKTFAFAAYVQGLPKAIQGDDVWRGSMSLRVSGGYTVT